MAELRFRSPQKLEAQMASPSNEKSPTKSASKPNTKSGVPAVYKVIGGVVAVGVAAAMVVVTFKQAQPGNQHNDAGFKGLDAPATCGAVYDPCGGQDFTGSTCCAAGSTCVYKDQYYSQCLPNAPDPGCSDVWGQCGGSTWAGPTCCTTGSSCSYSNSFYSQCLPDNTPTSAPETAPPTQEGYSTLWGQCAGQGYNGPFQCPAGSSCVYQDEYYSQCKPDPSSPSSCSAMWGQCGGRDWTGPTCCATGSFCVQSNRYYSQCLPNGSPTPAPTTPAPTVGGFSSVWGQCAGLDYNGPFKCPAGTSCVYQDDYYSQCKPYAVSGEVDTKGKGYDPAGYRCGPNFGGKTCPDGLCCNKNGQCSNDLLSCSALFCLPNYGRCKSSTSVPGRCGFPFGSDFCSTPGDCCSVFGWCGKGPGYCNVYTQSYARRDPNPALVAAPGATNTNGLYHVAGLYTCTGSSKCPNGLCCSGLRVCGVGSLACGVGCRPANGICQAQSQVTPGRCGPNFGGARCENYGECCNAFGWCGTGPNCDALSLTLYNGPQ